MAATSTNQFEHYGGDSDSNREFLCQNSSFFAFSGPDLPMAPILVVLQLNLKDSKYFLHEYYFKERI